MSFSRWIFAVWALMCLEISNGFPYREQYAIQVDELPQRSHSFQTENGQYQKSNRLEDGTDVGTNAWIDANNCLRITEYTADNEGYRPKLYVVYLEDPTKDYRHIIKEVKKRQTVDSLTLEKCDLPPDQSKGTAKARPKITSGTERSTVSYLSPTKQTIDFNKYPNGLSRPIYVAQPSNVDESLKVPLFGHREVAPQQVLPIEINALENDLPVTPTLHQHERVTPIERNGDNGFSYVLSNQYHEEKQIGKNIVEGSHGYVDPFGIRRIQDYTASPQGGLQVRTRNSFVGVGARAYDKPLNV